mmetsp:Transcript_8017/g.21429  ORF Transcript_8017/g.21429 Transcript_8017/m.21429 type:complete len:99 (+) Transcript_8017:590-886(+)
MDRAVKASDFADRRMSSTTALSPTATASNARLKVALLARRRHAGDPESVISSKAAFGMCVATPSSVTRRRRRRRRRRRHVEVRGLLHVRHEGTSGYDG